MASTLLLMEATMTTVQVPNKTRDEAAGSQPLDLCVSLGQPNQESAMIKHPRTTWVLVAHRTGAALYESLARGEALRQIESWDHPEGRLKPSDLQSDRPGRSFDRVGGGRHSLSTQESTSDHIDRAFALQLAQHLEQARVRNTFDRVVLVAPPHLLGALRQALSLQVQELVVATLDKDYMRRTADELYDQLREVAAL